jgi:TPR repeat protein
MLRETGSSRVTAPATGNDGPGDVTLRAVLAAVAGQYEILGEMGRGVAGTITYLARELDSSGLVILRLDPAQGGEGSVLSVLSEVSATMPGGSSPCPECGAAAVGWGRFCATCGVDLAPGEALHARAGSAPGFARRLVDPAGFQILGSVARAGAQAAGDVVFARELATGSVVALGPAARNPGGPSFAPPAFRILHTLRPLTAAPAADPDATLPLPDAELAQEPLPRAQPTAHRAAPQEVLLPSDDLASPDDRLPPRPPDRAPRWWIAPAVLVVAAVIGLGAFVKARASLPDGTEARVGSGGMGVASAPAPRPDDSAPAIRVDSAFIRIGGPLPEGSVVTIDGLPLPQKSVALVPGDYVLAATAPGHSTFTERLTLEAGQTLVWTPSLEVAESGESPPKQAPVKESARKTVASAKKSAPARADSSSVAAAPSPAQSCQDAYDAKDWAHAATLCAKEAGGGSVTAQRNLGVMYDRGVGVERDPARAAQLLRSAAGSGNRDAAFQLGAMYENGRGVAKDDGQAVSWYRRAALLGDREAQVKVGKAYEAGKGVATDMGEALTWYRKAAGQGDPWAQNYIGFLYGNGKGVPHDDVEALKWFRQAAANGNAQAEYNVGFMYANGRGVRHSDEEAVRWYRQAARHGYDEAQNELERRGIEP